MTHNSSSNPRFRLGYVCGSNISASLPTHKEMLMSPSQSLLKEALGKDQARNQVMSVWRLEAEFLIDASVLNLIISIVVNTPMKSCPANVFSYHLRHSEGGGSSYESLGTVGWLLSSANFSFIDRRRFNISPETLIEHPLWAPAELQNR